MCDFHQQGISSPPHCSPIDPVMPATQTAQDIALSHHLQAMEMHRQHMQIHEQMVHQAQQMHQQASSFPDQFAAPRSAGESTEGQQRTLPQGFALFIGAMALILFLMFSSLNCVGTMLIR